MPLFNFNYEGREFAFSDAYSLESFDPKKEIPENINGLSELDISHISLQKWAIVTHHPNEHYRSEINLLLLSFRIYSLSNAFIKWRFCKEDATHSTCLNDRFRILAVNQKDETTEQDLLKVKDGFLKILEMYEISDRTKNALYFIWRGLSSNKHIDAYIFLVCAIEALFSNESAKDVTKTLIKRTQKFLSGIDGFGGDQIKKIYKIRSGMIHGRIKHTDKKDSAQRKKNVDNVGKLEALVFTCIRKILDEKIYLIYRDTNEKEKFLNSLTKSNA